MKLRSEFFMPGQPAADRRVAEINAEGGFAWASAEYGNDMGVENVYWGHRVHYLTLDDMREHVQKYDAAAKAA